MSSSDRAAPRRDRPEHASAARRSGKARSRHAQAEETQYFDPGEPWDAEAAEALTRLYESGEGYLHRRPEDKDRSHRQFPHSKQRSQPEGATESDWLETRLADMASLLRASLSKLNPDKAVEHLNQRLDLLEQRFNDVIGKVAQRSDLDGLKLIEAHIHELAAHVEETRRRVDRLDAIDEQVQGVVRRLDAYDLHRLAGLEKLLQDYMSEWRRGDERTASALQNLEIAVGRFGEAIEAIEVYKPASDLSLSILGESQESSVGTDPISQVYSDAARVLEPGGHSPPLDAADYAPKAATGVQAPPAEMIAPDALPPDLEHVLEKSGPDVAPNPEPQTKSAGKEKSERGSGSKTSHASRSRLLLTGAVTLFAATGYLVVDTFMTDRATPRMAEPGQNIAAATEAVDGTQPSTRDDLARTSHVKSGRIEAIGSALAAALRKREDGARHVIQTAARVDGDLELADDAGSYPTSLSLPLTIGPASLRQAAMRGEPAAQIEVAARFATGQGVDRDLKQALSWYTRAAAHGSAIAQYRLAAMYERGLGAPHDSERARAWYIRAAEQGNIRAMHNLAVLSVSSGRSDYVAAAKWFEQAAERGLVDSQVNLAILCEHGLGVARDLAQAYKWFTLAARGGDAEASTRVAQLKARLSRSELEAADASIAGWRAQTVEPGANETSPPVLLDSSLH